MRMGVADSITLSRAYVVFEDNTTLWWLRLLKRGFRHCYLLFELPEKGVWLELNPMSDRFLVCVRDDISNIDYISYLEEVERKVVCEVEGFAIPDKCAPLGLFTCVEVVKRVLGLHDFFIITPSQLFDKIKNCRKKVLTNGFSSDK